MCIQLLEPNVFLHLNIDLGKSFYLSRKTSSKDCFRATNDKFGNRESTRPKNLLEINFELIINLLEI